VERLAALIERSPSSIRAHENGQNGINHQAAAIYAQALGSTPSFILWGRDEEAVVTDSDTALREVPILGEIAGDAWIEGYAEHQISAVVVSLPEYRLFELKAYIIGRKTRNFRKGDYVVVAPPDVGVRPLDQIVVKITDDEGRTKLSLAEVDLTLAGLLLRPLAGGADRIGARTTWNSSTATPKGRVEVIGPVVAYGGRERPSTGPVIPNEQIASLTLLA